MTVASIRVVMVDDHIMVREGLKALLQVHHDVKVVAEASSAEEALTVVDETPCDVVLLDIGLAGQDGLWCTRELKRKHPSLPVLILTMHVEDHLVVEALDAGADGYLVKAAARDELVRALREVQAGRTYLHPRVTAAAVMALRQRKAAPSAILSRREQEILASMYEGLSNKDICERLHVTMNTLKTHTKSLYRKLEATDRTQAILTGLRLGVIVSES